MSSKDEVWHCQMRLSVTAYCLLLIASCLMLPACSVPNLEPRECTEARDVIREFYSLHFGNDMAYSAENLEKRRAFLTPRLSASLRDSPPALDPFTLTDDKPKTFRVGECRVTEPSRRVAFDVLLFWKTDTRTEQRPIKVEAAKIEDRWLIDRID